MSKPLTQGQTPKPSPVVSSELVSRAIYETVSDLKPAADALKDQILANGGTLDDYRKAINTAFENVRKEYKLRG